MMPCRLAFAAVLALPFMTMAATAEPTADATAVQESLRQIARIHQQARLHYEKRLAPRRAEAERRLPDIADYELRFVDGVEGVTFDLHAKKRMGAWTSVYASVPYWRQEGQKEKFSYLHRDGVDSNQRDKTLHDVDVSSITQTGDAISGTMTVDFQRRWTKQELMPAGLEHLVTIDGRWSLIDQWRIVPADRTRQQRYQIEAQAVADAERVDLTLIDGIDGKPIHLRFRLPQPAGENATIVAPTFNAGVHRADVSGLTCDGKTLSGALKVVLGPDPWYPKDAHHITYRVDGRVEGGELVGTFEATITEKEDVGKRVSGQSRGRNPRNGPDAWEGRLSGRVMQAVEGRYRSSGPFGEYEGRIRGGRTEPAEPQFIGPLAEDATIAESARWAWRSYQQVRAIRLAMQVDPFGLADLMQRQQLPAPHWPDDAGDTAVVAFIRTLADRLAHHPGSRQEPRRITDPRFGPYYAQAALPTNEAGNAITPAVEPAGRAQRWQYVADWQVLGPFPQQPGRIPRTPDLPPLVYAQGAPYHVDADTTATWTAVNAAAGTLRPPSWTTDRRGEPTGEPGHPNTFWYAAARVESPTAQSVYLAIDALDRAELWINGKLVTATAEREMGYRTAGPTVVLVDLREGRNDLIVRCRQDRDDTWLQLAICTAGSPDESEKQAELVNLPDAKAETAQPPLAWDATTGANIAWRADLGGGGGNVLAVDGGLYVVVEPFTLLCLDPTTGEQQWRAEINPLEPLGKQSAQAWADAKGDDARLQLLKDRREQLGRVRSLNDLDPSDPVTDGKHIYVHFEPGIAACYTLAGERVWLKRTAMGEASVLLHEDGVTFSGTPLDSWADRWDVPAEGLTSQVRRAGGHFYAGHDALADAAARRRALQTARHAMLTLAADDGELAWALAANAAYAGKPWIVPLTGTDASIDVLLTRGGQVIDPDTGRSLIERLDLPAGWDWLGTTRQGNLLTSTFEGGRLGAALWINDAGQVGHRLLWRGQRFHAYVAGGPNPATITGDRLFVWRRPPEFAKHSPAYALQLDYYDAATGSHLGWIKPAIRGTNVALQPVVRGNYLYLGDGRGAPHTGGKPAERQMLVVRLDRTPVVISRNPTPHLSRPPVFVGDRMYLRCGDQLLCIAATTEAERQYQQQRIVQTVLEDLPARPATGMPRTIQPVDRKQLSDAPIVDLQSGATPTHWLLAGPYADADRTPDVDEYRPLDPNLIVQETRFVNDSRLDDWQQRHVHHRIDVSGLAADKPAGVVHLLTVLDNPADRIVYPTMPDRGLTTYLAGQPVAPGESVRLRPGFYPLRLVIEPKHFQPRVPLPPIDVAAAFNTGDVSDIGWPETWRVYGPLPQSVGRLSAEQLATPNPKIEVDGQPIQPTQLRATDHFVDLAALTGTAGGRVPQDSSAYAFATIDAPQAGHLLINAAADWRMAWFVDGELIYDTLAQGNRADPRMLGAHTFAVPVEKGEHTIAVLVRPGSKGWSFTSLGTFTTADPRPLAEKHPNRKGVRSTAAEHRISPALRIVTHPDAAEQAWQRYLRQRQPTLRWLDQQTDDPRINPWLLDPPTPAR